MYTYILIYTWNLFWSLTSFPNQCQPKEDTAVSIALPDLDAFGLIQSEQEGVPQKHSVCYGAF